MLPLCCPIHLRYYKKNQALGREFPLGAEPRIDAAARDFSPCELGGLSSVSDTPGPASCTQETSEDKNTEKALDNGRSALLYNRCTGKKAGYLILGKISSCPESTPVFGANRHIARLYATFNKTT